MVSVSGSYATKDWPTLTTCSWPSVFCWPQFLHLKLYTERYTPEYSLAKASAMSTEVSVSVAE